MVSPAFINFMIDYEHITSVITHCLSALAFFFLFAKTPKSGKPFARYLMLLQFVVTAVDLNFGVLHCPVILFPAPAGICEGLLCNLGLSSHIGQTIMFFTMGYVALSVVLCFHFKYESVVRLSNYRVIPRCETLLVRAGIFTLVTVPCLVYAACYTLQEGASEYITEARDDFPPFLFTLFQNFPTAAWIFSSGRATIAYDFSRNKLLSGSLLVTTLFGMAAVTLVCSLLIARTFKMLATQTTTMSTRTRSMQRDLMIILVIQMMIPVTLQIVPLLIYAISLAAELFTPEIVNIVFCVELLHASVHTIVLIATTPSYREPVVYWAKSGRSLVMRSPAPTNPRGDILTRVTHLTG